jgi:hypothetical protein
MHTESIEEHESEVNLATSLNLHSDGILPGHNAREPLRRCMIFEGREVQG